MMKKKGLQFILYILFVFAVMSLVSAQDYWISQVKVEGIEVDGTGYEYDDVEVSSDMFDMEPGVIYSKSLSLELPADMDVEDNEYTLYVQAYDAEGSVQNSYTLYLERTRHKVEIIDLLVSPSSAEAGESVLLDVRIKNYGDQKEEDIKVIASIDALGLSVSDYVDELAAYEEDNEDEEDSDSAVLTLNIPEDADAGVYELAVDVEYADGHETVEDEASLTIAGEGTTTTTTTTSEEVVITADTGLLTLDIGEEKYFKLSFANKGASPQSFTIAVSGTQAWADVKVSPSYLSIAAGNTEDAYIYVKPTLSGTYEFTVSASTDSVVEEINLKADVAGKTGEIESSELLKIGAIALVVVIIILLLAVALRKGKQGKSEEPLEPKEGQAYY
ncbi:hypothetical protein HZB88_01775 [archaeon]|nr:hypothetical protein [archaeon]